MSADLWRLGIQLFAEDEPAVDLVELIPVFHRWIQTQAIEGVLIDVADYSHVVDGPGIMLIAHEGNYGVERSGGRLSLVYTRKQPLEGDIETRLRTIASIALGACRALEDAPELAGRVRFRGGAVRLFANDRLLAPNDEATAAGLGPVFETLLRRLLGGSIVRIDRAAEPRERFALTAHAAAGDDADVLRRRVGDVAA